ncbi:RB1-inducible coiled-coil protein 1 [Nymphon striatum]|nr:RB1-inducible coiled-coil protein 1 [Nymphon striatum]
MFLSSLCLVKKKQLTMVYVFQVDVGMLRVFDMKLAGETVACLRKEITQRYNILEHEQVLLVSGGDLMDPNSRVYEYRAGTDENPIYLYNTANILTVAAAYRDMDLTRKIPPASTHLINHLISDELAHEIDAASNLSAGWKTLAVRFELVNKCFQMATDLHKMCNTLYKEQLQQQQGWFSCRASLKDLRKDYKTRSNILIKLFKKYITERESYIEMLKHFNEDISLLSQIPLLPALMKDIPVVSSTIATSEVQTLLQWISAKLNLENYTALEQDIDYALKLAKDKSWTQIQGLNNMFSKLDRLFCECRENYQKQQEAVKSFSDAKHSKEDSVVPDLCISYQKTLESMKLVHMELQGVLSRFWEGKHQFTTNLCLRFAYVIKAEVNIRDVDNKLTIYFENLKNLKMNLKFLKQIHAAPQIYFELISEVVQRRKFSANFNFWTNNIVKQSAEIYKAEITRRQKINQLVNEHFLKTLFPGLEDMPPSFADEKLTSFDEHLPIIEEADLSQLRAAFPGHKMELNIPETVKMQSYGKDSRSKEKSPPKSVIHNPSSKDIVISAAERKNWTISTSPPEPAPDITDSFVHGDQDRAKLLKLDQPSHIDSAHKHGTKLEEKAKVESPDSPSTALTSFDEDESLPSSYTESNGAPAASKEAINISDMEVISKSQEHAMENQLSLIETLKKMFLPWVTEAFGDNYVFMQDSAPSHTSNVTAVVQEPFQRVLRQECLASLQPRCQSYGFCYLKQSLKSELSLKSRCESFLEKTMKAAETQSMLKMDLEDLKRFAALQIEDFKSEIDKISSHIFDFLARQEEENKQKQKMEMQHKINLCNAEKDEVIHDIKEQLSISEDGQLALETKINELMAKVSEKESLLTESKNQYFELEQNSNKESVCLKTKMTVEHELELDSLRHELGGKIEQKDEELFNMKVESDRHYQDSMKYQEMLNKQKDYFENEFRENYLSLQCIQVRSLSDFRIATENELKIKESVDRNREQYENILKKQINDAKIEFVLVLNYIYPEWCLMEYLTQLHAKPLQVPSEMLEEDMSQTLFSKRCPTSLSRSSNHDWTVLLLPVLIGALPSWKTLSPLANNFWRSATCANEMEFMKNQELDRLRLALEEEKQRALDNLAEKHKNEMDAHVASIKEKLALEHKTELESLRSRFKLVQTSSIMDRSSGNLSPQKIANVLSRSPGKDGSSSFFGIESEECSNEARPKVAQSMTSSSLLGEWNNQDEYGDEDGITEKCTACFGYGHSEKDWAVGFNPGISQSMASSIFSVNPEFQSDLSVDLEDFKAEQIQLPQSAKQLINNNDISVTSCNPGDNVLIYFDEQYENFAVFLTSPFMHFLHEDSVKSLGLDKNMPKNKRWKVGKITQKEHCKAKKVQNRYNVEYGARFYRVKAQQLDMVQMIRQIKKKQTENKPDQGLL